jgi:Flp pilus assembly protein TadG
MGAVSDHVRALARRVGRLGRALARARDGGVAMIFALSLPVLTLMAVAGVDLHRASTVRMNLQDALDAATLAAARSSYMTNAELTRVGMASLRANLQDYARISLREDLTSFSLDAQGAVTAASKVDVDTLIAHIFLPPYGQVMDDRILVGATSQVVRSSRNVEVALVLDVTGSMSGGKLTALKSAANDLIDIVVQDRQTPYYSRAALVPYSMGVNVGSRAATVRGAVTPPAAVTGARWQDGTTTRSISGITRANPAVVTSNGHGYETNDYVWISGVNGMTQINNRAYRVTKINNNSFSLQGVSTSGSGYSNYSSGGSIRKCLFANCEVEITANNHGLNNGERVFLTGVRGMTQINNSLTGNPAPWVINSRTTNTYRLTGSTGGAYGAYTDSGASYCTTEGCEYYSFINASGGRVVHQISTCVSERTGSHAYNDRAPSSGLIGRNYPANSGNNCLSDTITPLTSNRQTLRTLIDGYQATGSTAGQIGIAWGWYMVSPTFGSMFTGEGRPGANGPDMLKVVVIMTDGEFNTPYCQGVIAANAGTGSGGNNTHINCNATNGSPFTQAERLCTGMKSQGIIVYTVGFDIPSVVDRTPNVVDTAEEVMQVCATSSDHVYLPSSGQALQDAFAAIGRDIAQLRLAR